MRARLGAREARRVEKPGLDETAVSLILTPGPRGPEALFIRRAIREGDPWSGHVGLPGGRREPEDIDLFATAVRETREEVGVELTASALLGPLDDLHPRTPTMPLLVIRPFAFALTEKPATTLSDEVAGTVWIPLKDLHTCASTSTVAIAGKPSKVECFAVGDLVIWGLTYRILRGFLPLLD